MTVKNCKVTDSYTRVDPQILYALIRVFHALSLPYVAHHSTVESLNEEFKGSDAESRIWIQHKLLIWLHFTIHSARLCRILVAILEQECALGWFVKDSKVFLIDTIANQRYIFRNLRVDIQLMKRVFVNWTL